MREYTIPLYCTCLSVTSAAKRRGLLPFGGRFVAEISVQKFKMTGVPERGRRKLYVDLTFVIVSQKLAELYSLT